MINNATFNKNINDCIELLIRKNINNIRCHTLAKITKIYAETNTIDAQPLIQEFRNTPTGTIPVTLPEIKQIQYVSIVPPIVGDTTILLHLDRNINVEKTLDGFYKPSTLKNNLSNCIALCVSDIRTIMNIYATREELLTGKLIVRNSKYAEYAEYASEDITKGTIEKRLTDLGFKSLSTSSSSTSKNYIYVANKVSGANMGEIGYVSLVATQSGIGGTNREGNRVTLQLYIYLNSQSLGNDKSNAYYEFYFNSAKATVTDLIPAEYRPKEDYTFTTYRRVYLDYRDSPLSSGFAKVTYMLPITCIITTDGNIVMQILTKLSAEFSGHNTGYIDVYTLRSIENDSGESDVTVSRTITLGYSAEPL